MDSYLAIAVALLAAVIAYFQWRTTHQAVVRDLFEARYEVYLAIIEATGEVRATGHSSDRVTDKLWFALHRGRFLFGPEVMERLKVHLRNIQTIEWHERHPNLAVTEAQYMAPREAMEVFMKEFDGLVEPYMDMTMKQSRFLRRHEVAVEQKAH